MRVVVGASAATDATLGMVRSLNYVGRSCPVVPSLRDVVWARPPLSILRAAVPTVNDGALACVVERLRRGDPVHMVFFGSSVTAGIRCKHKKERSVNFPQQLGQLIEHRYPQANLTIDVYGYPGASPSFMRACHTTLMRTGAADLYVLEMTDNLSDGYGGVGLSIEGLMGAVRQRAPTAALMLLAPIPQRCVRALKRMKPFQHIPRDDESTLGILRADCYSNHSVAASFEDVGLAHNVSTVSARHLVREKLFATPSAAGKIIGTLHYDAVHPSGAGHWQLAVAVEFALFRQRQPRAAAAQAAGLLPSCELPRAGLLESTNLFASRSVAPAGSMVCALGEDLHRHVLSASGWRYKVEYNSQGLPKPGYIADAPGATLDLCHRPDLAGLRRKRGSGTEEETGRVVSVAWSLGYLMSYEHMGRMRGECLSRESSCSCGTRVFDAHWRLPISQPHISRLKLQIRYARSGSGGLVPAAALLGGGTAAAAAAGCPCKIRFTLLNTTGSDGHKFKLVALMSGFYTGTIVSDAVGWAARYGIM